MRDKELILYKASGDDKLLSDMAWLMDHFDDQFYNFDDRRALLYECVHALIEFAGNHGFYGNLWHCYLTNLLVNHENAYSKGCEIRGAIKGSINEAALHDIGIFKEFYDFDLKVLRDGLNVPELDIISDYEASTGESKVYNQRICKRICELAERFLDDTTPEEMKETLTSFYKEYGVGKFGLHKSFRVVHDDSGVHIEPILNIAHVYLEDLVGYEIQKKKLTDNTDAFVEGRKANNCLLFGDAGTGKSSCIKGIANKYYEKGLRIIEIYKHQFEDLNDVIAQIKNRNYKFIIYMDDLSFEEFETEYKYLKAVIEGGLEKKPANVLIYATSNRRHLLREKFSDKSERDDDLHTNDTVQEKLSLVARFGVTIYFGSPSPNEFKEIVLALAHKEGLKIDDETLLAEANKWELSHGGLSGRTAQQFVDYLSGMAD
ncbi:MAG: ATP-binding protein [Lachnospiraceae bacterium]|nr:ATP-binding protein [Lachnospiraceae bacterium]MBR4993154.1 ATP-binding protein [Lachnospiraceae bacterium]MBR5944719.1 ATP-binding protein [Lachnospiraceae bacterium]